MSEPDQKCNRPRGVAPAGSRLCGRLAACGRRADPLITANTVALWPGSYGPVLSLCKYCAAERIPYRRRRLTRNKGKICRVPRQVQEGHRRLFRFYLVSRRSSAHQEIGRQKAVCVAGRLSSGLIAEPGQCFESVAREGEGVRPGPVLQVTESAAVRRQPGLDRLKCLSVVFPTSDGASVDGLVGGVICR